MSAIKKWFLGLSTTLKLIFVAGVTTLFVGGGLLLGFLLPKHQPLQVSASNITIEVGDSELLSNYDVNNDEAVVTFEIDSKYAAIKNFHIIGLRVGQTHLQIFAKHGSESASCVCLVTISEKSSLENPSEQETATPQNPDNNNKEENTQKPSGGKDDQQNPSGTEDENKPGSEEQSPNVPDNNPSQDDSGNNDEQNPNNNPFGGDEQTGNSGNSGNNPNPPDDSKDIVQLEIECQSPNCYFVEDNTLYVRKSVECLVRIDLNYDVEFSLRTDNTKIEYLNIGLSTYSVLATQNGTIEIIIGSEVVATINVIVF